MTPTAVIDEEQQLLFIHDCNALCGDGKTRLIKARSYVLGVPPWAVTSIPEQRTDPEARFEHERPFHAG